MHKFNNIMKQKITLMLSMLFLGLHMGFSQQNEEDLTTLSIMNEFAKSKNYDAAYEPFMELRKRNPKFNRAIFVHGEAILVDKIEKSTGSEKAAFINDLVKLYDERIEHYPADTPKGLWLAKGCQLMYENKDVLGKSNAELYECFDAVYTNDKATFTDPRGLYTYFSLMVDLYDAGAKPAEDLFNKYDDIVEKIEEEVKNASESLNTLIVKQEGGTALTGREEQYKNFYEGTLANYELISTGVDQKLGERAKCDNLIPLYEKGFEENKGNAVWLQRAAGKMSEKECTDSPLYFKIVNAYHELSPSASSAYFLAILKDKEGKVNEAIQFYEQAISLEQDNFRKAQFYSRIASKFQARGNYAKARSYYRDALKFNPSNLNPHLSIAAMYANSANDCGDTQFNKRAVYWLAAEEARKAGAAGAKHVESYIGRAPSKSDVFTAGNGGQTINIGCWIGASVKVPVIQ
jgi:tetratricopeptide (TPR) repeat protein